MGGGFSKICLLGFVPKKSLRPQDQDAPSLCVWGGHLSQQGFMSCLGDREGIQGDLPVLLISQPHSA